MPARASATLGSRLAGKITLNWMISLPFSKGFLYWGIPSPRTIFKSPVFITSPERTVIMIYFVQGAGCRCYRTFDCLYDEGPLIKGLYRLLEPRQGLCEADVHLHDEVLAVPLVEGVGLLVKHDDNVPRLQPGLLVPLPGECHLGIRIVQL